MTRLLITVVAAAAVVLVLLVAAGRVGESTGDRMTPATAPDVSAVPYREDP